jgi:hypothetical protein
MPGRHNWINKKTHEQFVAEMTLRGDIEVLGTYTGTMQPIKVRHLKCGHIFYPKATYLSRGLLSGGCAECIAATLNHKSDRNEFEQKLEAKHSHIKLVGSYVRRNVRSTFRCTLHNKNFQYKPGSTLTRVHGGCSDCYFESSGYKRYSVKIQKRNFLVQGYEPVFLSELFMRQPALFSEIKSGSTVPRVAYRGRSVTTGAMIDRTYFPDFYIPSKNLIVEVKSVYTAAGIPHEWKTLLRKRKATIEKGFNFKLALCSATRWETIPENWWTLTRKEFLDEILRLRDLPYRSNHEKRSN